MMRQPKSSPPPVPKNTRRADEIVEERSYRLITPLFGGGVVPKYADPISLVRIPSIRGHLRFWWRATRGIGPIAQVQKQEAGLWGATATQRESRVSKVQLELLDVKSFGEERPFAAKGREVEQVFNNIVTPHYAAFPLQPSSDELKKSNNPAELFAPLIKDVSFTLRLRYPKSHQADMEATLWAWETFGGIGARTRRGFGALRLDGWIRDGVKLKPETLRPPSTSSQVFGTWMQDKLKKHVLEGDRHPSLPHLNQRTNWHVFTPSEVKDAWKKVHFQLGKIQKEERQALEKIPPGAVMAWQLLVQKLRLFRQSRPAFPYENSEWPEADAIRQLTGQTFPKHAPGVRGIQVMRVFPRAGLGLPIVLHFKDGPDKTGKRAVGNGPTGGDPADHSILGEEQPGQTYERFASPVLLRPVVCADGGTAALALVIQGPISVPVPLMLRCDANRNIVAKGLSQTVSRDQAALIPPLKRVGEHEQAKPSIVNAFMNYLKGKTVQAQPMAAPYRKW